jgi:general secretion pathway protein M
MSFVSMISQWRARALVYWGARTEQERKFLAGGAVVLLLALVYLLLVASALEGRAQLRRGLPALRQQAAELQALAQEATALNAQPVPQVTPMTREALTASLSGRGLTAQSLSVSGEHAKLQLNNASFANLVMWLDAQRREGRIAVQDAVFTALPAAGQVDAILTLQQNTGAPAGAQ